MIERILSVVEGLDVLDQPLFTLDSGVIRGRDVIYFYSSSGRTFARLADDSKVEIDYSLTVLKRLFAWAFLQCQRFYLVRFDRIKGISRRYAIPIRAKREFPGLTRFFSGEALEAHLRFCRLHRIGEELQRSPDRPQDFKFHLYGTKRTVPITSGYHDEIKKTLGIRYLSHLTPEDPWLKKLRLLRIKDFGLREFKTIDVTDESQVEAFQIEPIPEI